MSNINSELSDRPYYSIVIPCFNSSKTISTPLSSILSQSFKDFEVIVVDDSSHDFAALDLVIEGFITKGMTIKVIRHKENSNGASARNTGIEASTGKYIAFLDSDDEWSEEKLEKYKNRIDQAGEACIFYSRVRIVGGDGQTQAIRPKQEFSGHDMSEYLFLEGGFIQTSSIVVSLDDARKIKFDERFKRHQDYDFCLRANAMGLRFVFVNEPLTIYHSPNKKFYSKNEDVKYCLWWAKEMKKYMSKDGYNGYLFFSLTNRMLQARNFRSALINAVKSVSKLGFIGVWKARRKLLYILNIS